MSRSRRKNPMSGICLGSDRDGKKTSMRIWRRAVKYAVFVGDDPPHEKEYRDPWKWRKDGKYWWGHRMWKWDKDYQRKMMGK